MIYVESPQGSGFVSTDSTRGKFFTGGLKVASGHSIELEDFLK
ncbi:hypothetical protein ACFFXY_24540 [Glycomyces mayteni]